MVADYHKARLAVYNMGSSAGTIPSTAQVLNKLVRPASVILSHVNEAATEDGKLRPDSRTAGLYKLLKGPVPYLAISGRTMEFDGKGKYVAGCG